MSTEKFAPYAPFGCVMAVIRRLRERGLPETITLQEVIRVGVSEGNASRTLQALRFLKLVDEEGYRTQIVDRLARVPTSEYPEVFREIIKEAYQDVFVIIDPVKATDIEINDAFRYYHPQAQRARMVTLFKSLCQEVSLIAGGPPETRKKTKAVTAGKSLNASHVVNSRRSQTENSDMAGISSMGVISVGYEFALLQGLLQQLPANKKWTQERRDRWLQAFTASIDLVIDIED